MSKEKKFHFHLVCGTLLLDAGEDSISSVSLNAIIHTEVNQITVKDIGHAQQALQMNFHQRMQGETFKVVDIVIASFSYLGFMAPSKFNEKPEGMELVERPSTDGPYASDSPVDLFAPSEELEEAAACLPAEAPA